MRLVATCFTILALGILPIARADEFAIDPTHAGFTFKIQHLGLSWTYGRFNAFDGAFRIDPNPANTAFAINIQTDSIDTGNKQRDDHLRSPDWFNSKQFPLITFKSTSVKPVEGGLEVTGDLTLHGVTKAVVLKLEGGGAAEFPPGVKRTGYTTNVIIKRSDFGMATMVGPVSDEVYLSISFEGIKK
jgi:polyisoprenoid-binding protein YceI